MILDRKPTASAPTRFAVGLEEGADGWTHVHGFDLPGCVASGSSGAAALSAFEGELAAWLTFLRSRGDAVPSRERELEIVVEEWILTDADVEGGETDVCFEADRAPLSRDELLRRIELLGALRGRLLPRIGRARNSDLEAYAGVGFSARKVLEELARAQWWTLTRLGASPLAAVPDEVVGRLDTAIALAVDRLSNLGDEALSRSLALDGEEWTPRKVIRRLLWLEWSLGGAALQILDSHLTRVS